MGRQEVTVRNFIQIGDQEEVLFDLLLPEQRREVSQQLKETFMKTAGYRRVTKEGAV